MLTRRIAAALALIAFSFTLVIGAVQAGNSFGTIVLRALAAMAATFVLGLITGAMLNRMVEENVAVQEKKLKELSAESTANDR